MDGDVGRPSGPTGQNRMPPGEGLANGPRATDRPARLDHRVAANEINHARDAPGLGLGEAPPQPPAALGLEAARQEPRPTGFMVFVRGPSLASAARCAQTRAP